MHAILTDGAFTTEGEFLHLTYFAAQLVEKVEGGRLRVRTPPGPHTGLVEKILDPLDPIHALTTLIPDPGQHMVRQYGSYSNRSRGGARGPREADATVPIGPRYRPIGGKSVGAIA